MGSLAHLAKLIKYAVKINQDLALCHLGDVVHCFAGIVPNPSILVCEASEDWRYYLG